MRLHEAPGVNEVHPDNSVPELIDERLRNSLLARDISNSQILGVHENPDVHGDVNIVFTWTRSRSTARIDLRRTGEDRFMGGRLERIIEQNKERYYEVLELSSQGWHEGKHDPWPVINFLLYILVQTSREFKNRIGQLKSPRGEKTAAVIATVERQTTVFRIADVQADCPGVGVDLIRRVLANLRKENRIRSFGTGRGAQWEKAN